MLAFCDCAIGSGFATFVTMLFTEIRFAVFFVICLSVYWTLKRTSHRHVFLLVMSYIFYAGWDVRFLALIAYSTAVTYIGSHLLRDAPSAQRRRRVLIVTIVMQLASLYLLQVFRLCLRECCRPACGNGAVGKLERARYPVACRYQLLHVSGHQLSCRCITRRYAGSIRAP